jgi:hypothetical protein
VRYPTRVALTVADFLNRGGLVYCPRVAVIDEPHVVGSLGSPSSTPGGPIYLGQQHPHTVTQTSCVAGAIGIPPNPEGLGSPRSPGPGRLSWCIWAAPYSLCVSTFVPEQEEFTKAISDRRTICQGGFAKPRRSLTSLSATPQWATKKPIKMPQANRCTLAPARR